MQKKILILLTNESKECVSTIMKLINKNIKNTEILTFENKKQLIRCDHLEDADLIISDISVSEDKEELRAYHDQLIKVAAPLKIPLLLVVSDETFDESLVDYFAKCAIYDFIRKPYNYPIFVNRVRVLLNIPRTKKSLEYAKRQVELNLWNSLNYSNLLILVLDKIGNIKLCNYRLGKFLGFEKEEDLVGKSWFTFLNESDQSIFLYIQEKMTSQQEGFEEVAYDIATPDGSVAVKWFVSFINGDLNWTFCVGMPIYSGVTVEDNLDTLRSYFRDIIVKDRTTINAMKEVTKKFSEQIQMRNKLIEDEDSEPYNGIGKIDVTT